MTMKNLLKNREPLTPAQKKIAAAIVCLVLVVVASMSFDLLLGNRDDAASEPPTVMQTVEEEQPEDEPATESGEAEEDAPEEADESAFAGIAVGDTLDAGDLSIMNNTDREVGEECGALASSLRTFLMASGLSYSGTQFSVVDFTSTPDTGAATFFLTSPLAGAQYIMAQRASADVDFQISTATDEVGFTALMDQALNGGTAAATEAAPTETAPADASANAAAPAATDAAAGTEGGM